MQIFTNAFPVHYSPPEGFDFEVSNQYVPVQVPIPKQSVSIDIFDLLLESVSKLLKLLNLQDNPLLFDYNVQQRVDDFVNAAITQVCHQTFCMKYPESSVDLHTV